MRSVVVPYRLLGGTVALLCAVLCAVATFGQEPLPMPVQWSPPGVAQPLAPLAPVAPVGYPAAPAAPPLAPPVVVPPVPAHPVTVPVVAVERDGTHPVVPAAGYQPPVVLPEVPPQPPAPQVPLPPAQPVPPVPAYPTPPVPVVPAPAAAVPAPVYPPPAAPAPTSVPAPTGIIAPGGLPALPVAPQPNPGALPAVTPTPGALPVAPQTAPGTLTAAPPGAGAAAPTLGAAVNPLPISTGGGSGSEPKVVEVGSDPTFRAYWEPGRGMMFETANKDWQVHLGGRFQFEPVFWAQPTRLKGPAPGNGGIPNSARGDGVGPLDDGVFFRRVRLKADGTAYDLIEFNFEVDFEQLNFITYDHLWAGFKDLPILGTVRVGQMKVPQGMDNMASDYFLTFLERGVLSEGIWAALFAPGIQISNTFFKDNVTFQTMFHRIQPINQFFTSDFGDGDYASTTRLTWTPLYANEGEQVVHIGSSYQWRHADLGRTIQPGGTGNTFADTQSVVRFRARPELRDAIGIGAGGNLGGDTARFVDTGFLLASNVHTFSPEFLTILGPFSVQAEAAWAFVEDARSIYPTGPGGASNNIPRGSPTFWGGYIETSYFLTGEHRGYDRRFGIYDRPKVRENFFLVRGENGRINRGLGAWQIAYRYSYLDLNSNGVNGGQLGQHTFGLNWYLNDNTKLQFQYSNIQRNVIGPAVSGTVHGFGILGQWYF